MDPKTESRVARERRARARRELDLDIPAFVTQVKALPVFRDAPRSIARTTVKIVPAAWRGGGRAHGSRMVRIRYTPTTGVVWLLEAIVHELVHAALPSGVVHNERFRRTLARAARELWGIDVHPNPVDLRGRVGRYALDRLIETALEPIVARGDYPKRPAEAPADPGVLRKERTLALVEKRSAHAAKMLSRAERRLKLARTLADKWRRKVRRYERMAAKSGS